MAGGKGKGKVVHITAARQSANYTVAYSKQRAYVRLSEPASQSLISH